MEREAGREREGERAQWNGISQKLRSGDDDDDVGPTELHGCARAKMKRVACVRDAVDRATQKRFVDAAIIRPTESDGDGDGRSTGGVGWGGGH